VLTAYSVSALYDFETAGPGIFTGTFAPITTFQVARLSVFIQSQTDLSSIEATSNTVENFVSPDIAKRVLQAKSKRGTVSCSITSLASAIAANYTEAKALVFGATSYITSNGANLRH